MISSWDMNGGNLHSDGVRCIGCTKLGRNRREREHEQNLKNAFTTFECSHDHLLIIKWH